MSLWTYRDEMMTTGSDVVGYDVDAIDGNIGKIDDASTDVDNAHIVVDTGWWIFGKKRLIPAGAISSIDHADGKVAVQMTKNEIKDAPDYLATTDQSVYDDYYGPFGSFGQ